MAKPVDDRSPAPSHPYGDYNRLSADGSYYFEWTSFTPAIRAWEKAARHLRNARDKVGEARKVTGFAIPGLEHECEHFKGRLKVHADDLDDAAREAQRVVQILEVANTDYANARDESLADYEAMMRVVDSALAAQGRPRVGAGIN
jgi:hypothetical protein